MSGLLIGRVPGNGFLPAIAAQPLSANGTEMGNAAMSNNGEGTQLYCL